MPFQLSDTTVLWGMLFLTVLGLGAIAAVVARRYFGLPTRKVLAALIVVEGVLAALHVVYADGGGSFQHWLFNLNLELTAGAVFSAAQCAVIAMIALVNGLGAPRLKLAQRAFWILLMAVFVWISLDEFLELHETVPTWRSAYMLAGGGVVLASAAAYWFLFRGETELFVPLVLGLAIMGGAGVVLDALTNDHDLVVAGMEIRWLNVLSCDAAWNPIDCGDVNVFGFVEELLEMGGASLVLAAVANYFQRRQPATRFHLLRRLATVTVLTWVLLWASSFWVAPSIAEAVNSEPARVDYLDGRLSLVSYDLSREVLVPGDTLTVSLFFRANTVLPEDYRVAVKLITRYEDETLAETDAQIGEWKYPSSAWLPGFTVRHNARLHVPEGAATPRSYHLTARVWHEEEAVEVASTTLEQVGEGTVVLRGMPVLSPGRPPAPPVAADYHFADGPVLAGYDVPSRAAAGEVVELRFWWQTDRDVPVELNQFVHFMAGDGSVPFAVDQAPFGGENFPTVYWPAGMGEVARWQVVVPADLPGGVYELYTGLYTLPDAQRAGVVSGAGEPVLNNLIRLGQIEIEGSG